MDGDRTGGRLSTTPAFNKCPNCHREFVNIHLHLRKNSACSASFRAAHGIFSGETGASVVRRSVGLTPGVKRRLEETLDSPGLENHEEEGDLPETEPAFIVDEDSETIVDVETSPDSVSDDEDGAIAAGAAAGASIWDINRAYTAHAQLQQHTMTLQDWLEFKLVQWLSGRQSIVFGIRMIWAE